MPKIIIVGTAAGEPTEFDGKYIVSYDPNYMHRPDGYDGGNLVVTDDPEQATDFTTEEALRLWKSQAPPPYHLRPDGKPNRPLSAFTLEVSGLSARPGAGRPASRQSAS